MSVRAPFRTSLTVAATVLALCAAVQFLALVSTVARAEDAPSLRVFRFAALAPMPVGTSELFFGLGAEKGWFKEAGIDFRIVPMQVTVVFPAMLAGEIDGAYYAGSAPLAALRGAPFVTVYYPHVSVDWSLIVDPKKIATAKDFSGARCIAGTGAKSATQIAFAAMIASLGGDARNFQTVGTGQPASYYLEALRLGTAACTMGVDSAWAGAAQREGFKVMAHLAAVEPMQTYGLAVTRAALKDPGKRAAIEDVIGVFLRSQDYITDPKNRAEIVALMQRWMGAPPGMQTADYEAALDALIKLYPPEHYIADERIFGNLLHTALKYGIFDPKEFAQDPTSIDLAKAGFVDQSLVKDVASLGGPLYRRQ